MAEQLICNQQVAGSSPIASSINSDLVRFPSGQREQTVNLPSLTSMVRIHPSPPSEPVNLILTGFFCYNQGVFWRFCFKFAQEKRLRRKICVRMPALVAGAVFLNVPVFLFFLRGRRKAAWAAGAVFAGGIQSAADRMRLSVCRCMPETRFKAGAAGFFKQKCIS